MQSIGETTGRVGVEAEALRFLRRSRLLPSLSSWSSSQARSFLSTAARWRPLAVTASNCGAPPRSQEG